MSFDDLEETAEIYFFSKELYKYISGLDLISSNFLKMVWKSTGDVPVRMVTESATMGEVELEIKPHDHRSDQSPPIIMRELSMGREMVGFHYRCKFIAPALEALKRSNHVRMKCGQSGLLLMEHFHGQENRIQSVQYFVLCEADVEKLV
jgi:hypothetical protein